MKLLNREPPLTAILIGGFSCWYVTSLPISPFYIITGIGLIFLAMTIAIRSRLVLLPSTLIAVLFLVYLLASQPLLQFNGSTLFGLILSLIVYIAFSINRLPNIRSAFLLLRFIVLTALPLLIVESVYRLTNPVINEAILKQQRTDLYFQFYKVNSIMFTDSNFVGLMLVALLSCQFYLRRRGHGLGLFWETITSILIVLTLSRASVVSCLIAFLVFLFWSSFLRYQKIILYLSPAVFLVCYFIFRQFSWLDESYESKFRIVEMSLATLAKAAPLSAIFGVGLGNAHSVLGIGAHNIFIVYLIETGLMGFGFFVLLWFQILRESRYRLTLIMAPYLFNGLSVSSTANAYMYVIFSVVISIERKMLKKESNFDHGPRLSFDPSLQR